MMRPPARYRTILIADQGDLPLPCHFCGEAVTDWPKGRPRSPDGIVHHLDEDRSNNDPSNLAVGHHGCHSGYHSVGRVTPSGRGRIVSPETRAKMAAARRGITLSPETRAKISAAKLGHKDSEETKAKRAAALRGRTRTPAERAAISGGMTGKPWSEERKAAFKRTCECCGRSFAANVFARHKCVP